MTMRSVQYDRYGGTEVLVLRSEEVPRPGRGQVLVRVHAAALNPKDVIVRSGRLRIYRIIAGSRFPKRVGFDWSGEALALGAGVTDVRVGDALYGMIDAWSAGACATHAVVEVGELAPRPASLSWEQAAAVPLAAMTALQALRDVARLERGQRVLVNGASGGVGTFAVQIAKALGARVTAVTSARNAARMREIGADEVLDYAEDDLRAKAGQQEIFFDVFGNRSFPFARALLSANGTYVSTVPKGHLLRDTVLTALRGKRARLVSVRSRAADLVTLTGWIEQGLVSPVIDRVFPLEEVAAAEDQVATRRARGKVVIRIGDG